MSEADYDKLKDVLHALATRLVRPRPTEKSSAVLQESEASETPGLNRTPTRARRNPAEWMPWNYRETLARVGV